MRIFLRLSLLCCTAAMGSNVMAKPVSTTADRERARCEAHVDLCDQVAQDDLGNCNAAGQSNCSDNYYEDINQCTADYNDCLDEIAHTTGGGLGGKGSIHLPAVLGTAGVLSLD